MMDAETELKNLRDQSRADLMQILEKAIRHNWAYYVTHRKVGKQLGKEYWTWFEQTKQNLESFCERCAQEKMTDPGLQVLEVYQSAEDNDFIPETIREIISATKNMYIKRHGLDYTSAAEAHDDVDTKFRKLIRRKAEFNKALTKSIQEMVR